MRYCSDCKKKFKEEDAIIAEYESKEAVGKGDFPWQKLETFMRKIDTCPHCESLNHFGMIEDPELGTFQAPHGSLILSPEASKERCEKLYKDWMKETFE